MCMALNLDVVTSNKCLLNYYLSGNGGEKQNDTQIYHKYFYSILTPINSSTEKNLVKYLQHQKVV